MNHILLDPATSLPLISCICVTRQRPELLERAIACFYAQTYSNKQLVIVYENDDQRTLNFLTKTPADSRIKIVQIHYDNHLKLGQLRNIGINQSDGEYICQWDDDDFYHCNRLEYQFRCISASRKSACVLNTWLLFDNSVNTAFVSNERLWEGSLLCTRKSIANRPYPNLSRGEDSEFILRMHQQNQLAVLDYQPQLYVYVYHGTNTWNYQHFRQFFQLSHKLSSNTSNAIGEMLRNVKDVKLSSLILDEMLAESKLLQ